MVGLLHIMYAITNALNIASLSKESSAMYVVTVFFTLVPGQARAFLPLMLANAKTSLEQEAECLVFDVCQNPDAPDQVFLYEVYSDGEAFALHLGSEHFKAFDSAISAMVLDKQVQIFDRLALG